MACSNRPPDACDFFSIVFVFSLDSVALSLWEILPSRYSENYYRRFLGKPCAGVSEKAGILLKQDLRPIELKYATFRAQRLTL